MNKTSKFEYDPEIHTRKKMKLDYFICDNCKSIIGLEKGSDVNGLNKGICFFCKKGHFIIKE
jgi:hypothetical protein